MKISIAQFKSEIGAIKANFSTAERLIAAAKGSDVIILPELWSTGYYPMPIDDFADIEGENTIKFISEAAKRHCVNIIGGSVAVKSGGKVFNRLYVANRQGKIVSAYDKTHLFSFAKENEVFSAGDKISTVELDNIRCGLAICYDLRFPEFIRRITLMGVQIIYIPAAWSLKRLIPRQILTKARAIENQIFIVFANSAGISEIINPNGEIIAQSGTDECILSADVDFNERKRVISVMNLLSDRNLRVDS